MLHPSKSKSSRSHNLQVTLDLGWIVVVDSVHLTADLTAFSSPPVNSSTFSYPWLEKRASIDGEALFCVSERQDGMMHQPPAKHDPCCKWMHLYKLASQPASHQYLVIHTHLHGLIYTPALWMMDAHAGHDNSKKCCIQAKAK